MTAIVICPLKVGAQDAAVTASPGALEEVVVTAQKRSEDLQKVPITISAVSSEQLQAAGVLSTADIGNAVAGVAVNVTASYFAPHVRGIGTTSFGPGVENPVALYVDNVYYASQLAAPADLSDVSQVAVLKGPQGTLFGRNATAGVIQMTTRDPESEFAGEFKTELDNYLTSRNFAYLTGGVTSELAGDVALSFTTQGHGWGTNLETGAEVHRVDHDLEARSKWVWTPSETTTVRLNMDFTDQKNSLGPNLVNVPGTLALLPGIGSTILPSNIYDVDSPINDRNDFQGGGASITVEQDLGFARLVNITAYRRYLYDTYFDAAGSSILADYTYFDQPSSQFSEELQLVSPNSGTVTWTAGVYYFGNQESVDGPLAILVGPEAFAGTVDALLYDYTLQTQSVAGYAQATTTVLPDTHLTTGLRYTYEKRSEVRGSVTTVIDDSITIPDVVPPSSITASRPTWRLALDHDFTDRLMGYVSYNRGFKSGGYNALAEEPNAPPYKPETLDAYELGLKAETLGHSLRINPGLFYYDYSQIQVTELTGSNVNIINGAKAQLYGLDLDFEWRSSTSLSLIGGLEWLHSRFTDFPNVPSAVPTPGGGSTATILTSAAGNQLPFAPTFTGNIGADYTVHAGQSTWSFNVTDSYNSGFYTEPDNVLRQSSFDYLNAAIGWISNSGRLNVRIWGRNLLNKAVATQLSTVPPTGYSADYANPPRTYGFTLRYNFGR
jgi:iron complex outermembrane recepter protein